MQSALPRNVNILGDNNGGRFGNKRDYINPYMIPSATVNI